MAQFRVPQNIFMPDKIIGPLTLAQFLYLFIAGAIALGLYYAFPNNFLLFFVLAAPVVGLGAALAFVKFNGQPFNKMLASLLVTMLKPRRRMWSKLGPEEPIVKAPKPVEKKVAQKRPSETELKSKLKSLALMLDTEGWASIKEKRSEVAQINTSAAPTGNLENVQPLVAPVAEEEVNEENVEVPVQPETPKEPQIPAELELPTPPENPAPQIP